MVHLRIVVPPDRAEKVHALLCGTRSAIDVVRVPNASTRPDGDLIMCDVAREDASVIISDLRHLGIHKDGSISLSPTDTISDYADAAVKHAPGSPADAVIWEELDERTSESVELSARLPALHGARGDHRRDRDLPRQPDPGRRRDGRRAGVRPGRGPVRRARPEARRARRRSATALAVGFPLAIGATVLATLRSTPPTSSPTRSTPPPRAREVDLAALTRSRSSSPSAPARRAC